MLPTEITMEDTIANPSSIQIILFFIYFYISSISYLIACEDFLNNPFCNDLPHNLSLGTLIRIQTSDRYP